MSTNWLTHQHPDYSKKLGRWKLVDAFYTGNGVSSYLQQHKQGESNSSFEERSGLAQFQPLLADVVDSLAGILFQNEEAVERDWGTLGRPEARGSTAAHIWQDCDGDGMNYSTMLRRLAVNVVIFQELWILVEGPTQMAEATVKLLPPSAVPNWLGDEVLVKESVDVRQSITDTPEMQEQYVLYDPKGWRRFQSMKSGGASGAVQIASGLYNEAGRVYTTRSGHPAPPIFRLSLPFERHVSHILADSARVLFNMESDRDHLQRSISYPKLVISGDDEFFGAQVKMLKKGSNVLQLLPTESGGRHEYIAPDTGGIDTATATLENKVKRFYDSAWRLFDAEGQKLHQTATGAALERSSGLASALAMIAQTLAEAETQILHLLAQCYSDNAADWAKTGCEWPTDYASVEMKQAA